MVNNFEARANAAVEVANWTVVKYKKDPESSLTLEELAGYHAEQCAAGAETARVLVTLALQLQNQAAALSAVQAAEKWSELTTRYLKGSANGQGNE